jgi:hypothetical protein
MASAIGRVVVVGCLIMAWGATFGLLRGQSHVAESADRPTWSLHRPYLYTNADSTTFDVACELNVSGHPEGDDNDSDACYLTLRQLPQTQDQPPVAKPQPNASEPAEPMRTLNVPGIGEVTCVLPRTIYQPAENLDVKQLQRSLLYRWSTGDSHWEAGGFRSTGQAMSFHNSMDVPHEVRKKAIDGADKTDTMNLLLWLGQAKPRLGRLEHVTHLEWEAALDGTPFQPVTRCKDAKTGETFHLAARPGQTVTFRATFVVTRYEVTLNGVALTINPADIDRVLIEEVKNPIENTRRRTLTFAPIQITDWTRASLHMDFQATSPQDEYVYWRVGDPEEEWLFSGNYPLAPPIPISGTDERRMASIVQDLNRAFNRDRNGFFLYRGYGGPDGWLDRQREDHWGALADLDLSSAPHLRDRYASLRDRPKSAEHDPKPDPATFLKRHSAEAKRQQGDYPPLWQPLAPRDGQDGSPSWHSAGDVHRLAVLYRDDPALRSSNPLRKVLDSWAVAMPEHSEPNAITHGKGMYVFRDSSGASQLRAIAALQLGAKLFGEKKFNELAARQRDWFRQRLNQSGAWELLEQRSGRAISLKEWQSNHHQRPIYEGQEHDELVEPIAAWGQLAVWEENMEELERVRDWIRTALARSDEAGRLAHAHYIGCQFEHRLSLLAVLRGRASLLDALPVADR